MKVLKWLFGEDLKSSDKGTCIRNDQSYTAGSELVVGTYVMFLDGVSLGSTTGGCNIKINSSGTCLVSTRIRDLSFTNLKKLFGFRCLGSKTLSGGYSPPTFESLVIEGPGPGCSIRTYHMKDAKVVSEFDYTIKRGDASDMLISFAVQEWVCLDN